MKRSLMLCMALIIFGYLCAQTPFVIRNSQYLGFDGKKIELPNGNTMIFWNDTSAGSSDIMAQKISPEGTVLWANPRVVANGDGEQRIQQVVLTSDQNVGVLFFEYFRDNGAFNYRVQKLSQAGQPLWGAQGMLVVGDDSYYDDLWMVPNGIGGVYCIFRSGNPNQGVFGMNLDNFGTNLWPNLPLPGFDGTYHLEAIADGCGGVIINNWVYVNGQGTQNMLTRLDEAGDVVGANPMVQQGTALPTAFNLIKDTTGNFILYTALSASINMQKMDVNGVLLLPGIVNITVPDTENPNQFVLQPSPGGGAVLAYITAPSNESRFLKVMALDNNLQPIWASPSSVTLSGASNDLTVDVANGIWCSWLSWEYVGNYNNATVYCGKLNSDGNLAVSPLAISGDMNSKQCPVIKSQPGKALVIWNDMTGETNSFREQLIDNSGTIHLAAGGRNIYGVLNGGTDLDNTLPLGNNTLHIYADSRKEWQSRMYYQLTDPTGSPLLMAGGKALNPGSNLEERYLDSRATANNTALLLYSTFDGSSYSLWLQEISAGGYTNYPGLGLCLALNSDFDYSRSMLGQINSDILVAWPVLDPVSYCFTIWGQRISGGVIQWPAGGKLLLEPNADNLTPMALMGDYFVFTTESYSEATIDLKALKIGPTGDPATGWPVSGLMLFSPSPSFSQYQHSGLVNGNLVVFCCSSDDYISSATHAQMISPSGQLLWGTSGTLISEYANLDFNNYSDAVYGSDVTYLITNADTGELCINKLNQAGNKLWGDLGISLGSQLSNIQDYKLVRFANGTFSAAFSRSGEGSSGLYKVDVSASGEVLSDAPACIVNNRYYITHLHVATSQNCATLAWNDIIYYDRGEAIYLSSLWDCRIDASPVSVDEHLPPPLVDNAKNFPNPFRESTTISFGLKDASPVQVDIYNLKGQHIRSLMNEAKTPGNYDVNWDGRDLHGQVVADGVYFFKIQAGTFSSRKKMILLK